jgi:hypothetical protein
MRVRGEMVRARLNGAALALLMLTCRTETPVQAVERLLSVPPKGRCDAHDAAVALGDRILPPLREQTDNFVLLQADELDEVADLLACSKAPLLVQAAEELSMREELVPRLLGDVVRRRRALPFPSQHQTWLRRLAAADLHPDEKRYVQVPFQGQLVVNEGAVREIAELAQEVLREPGDARPWKCPCKLF